MAIQLTNRSGLSIAEFWLGHNPGNAKARSTMVHFKISKTVQPVANNATYTDLPKIQLASSSTDKWLFYWKPLVNNDLIGLKSQWFSAEVQTKNGTVTVVVNQPGGDFQVQQVGKTIKSQGTTTLQTPQVALWTGIVDSSNYGTTIDGLFRDVGLEPPAGQSTLGICLSGGGTRAMCAGMGQLQALASINHNGKSLLSQVKALSSVSGGGWVSAPYIYLNSANSDCAGTGKISVSDANFLNTYVSPGQLTTRPTGNAADVGYLPPGNIGHAVTSGRFGLADIAAQFLVLLYTCHRDSNFPKSLIWQTIVGKHMLAPYGLYCAGAYWRPTKTYSYSPAALKPYADVAQMAPADFYDPTRAQRPLHVANMSMKVKDARGIFAAMVTATPLSSGMFGHSTTGAKTEHGAIPIGNGAIANFALNSYVNEKAAVKGRYDITQVRQWGLSDSVGVSSAFLAAVVWLYLKEASQDEIFRLLVEEGPRAAEFLGEAVPDHVRYEIRSLADPALQAIGAPVLPAALIAFVIYELVQAIRAEGDATVPHYAYWPPVSNAADWPPEDNPNIRAGSLVTEFADGGLLENLGLATLLSFEDISVAYAFMNTSEPLAMGPAGVGVVGTDGKTVPNTNVIVDEGVAALFGYMAYDHVKGYVLYPASTGSLGLQERCLATVKIFSPNDFPTLLKGLAAAAGKDCSEHPAVFTQLLSLQQNALFNIKGGRAVTVTWFYLNAVADWRNQLKPDVAALLAGEDFKNFPHYSTMFETELTKQQYNLLANLTAWTVKTALNAQSLAVLAKDA